MLYLYIYYKYIYKYRLELVKRLVSRLVSDAAVFKRYSEINKFLLDERDVK